MNIVASRECLACGEWIVLENGRGMCSGCGAVCELVKGNLVCHPPQHPRKWGLFEWFFAGLAVLGGALVLGAALWLGCAQ